MQDYDYKSALECARRLFSLKFGYQPNLEDEKNIKKHLLTLVYSNQDASSPINDLWSLSKRSFLAAEVRSILIKDLGGEYPLILIVLR